MQILRTILYFISTFFLSVWPTSSLIEGVTGQPLSFFPHQSVSQTDKTISSLIYKGLFKHNSNGEVVPSLAESWDISEDGLIYTIKIKEGQKWSDGQEVTSDDLIYTAFKLPDLMGVATDKVDRYTVRYTLPNKFSPFLSILSVGVMQVNSTEKQNPIMPVSNGDFYVVSAKKEGPAIRRVVLYNRDPNGEIKKLVFKYYSSESELLTAADLGEVDSFISSDQFISDRFKLHRFSLEGIYYGLFFNLREEKLQDQDFRLKLAQVLPIKDLVAGLGEIVEGPISKNLYTADNVDFEPYVVDFSAEFLDKSLTITVPDLKKHRVLAQEIEKIWEEKLGLTVTINLAAPEVIRDHVIPARDFEVLLYGQQVGQDPDRYVNWHSTQSDYPGLNLTGFDQMRADRALEEGRAILDSEERKIHYNDFQHNLMENTPVIFLYHPYINYYISNRVSGADSYFTEVGDSGGVFNARDRFSDFSEWKKHFLN